MKFPYRKIALNNPFNSKTFILRPIKPISLKNNNLSIRYEALIDSGADFSIFPLEIAQKLGITLKNSEAITFAGVGENAIVGLKAKLSIEIGSKTFNMNMVFASIENGILGQYEFFDLFIVRFDLKKNEIEIKIH